MLEGFNLGLIGLGTTFLLLAIAAWLWAKQLQKESGLPKGNLIYTDTGVWFEQHETLVDRRLGLSGKPDYLVEESGGMIIPVELKSGKAPSEPYEGHVMQLAAYCLLVETHYQIRPDYGIIQYEDKAFAIQFSDELEETVLELLSEMREDLYDPDPIPDHEEAWRCRGCGVREYCDYRMD